MAKRTCLRCGGTDLILGVIYDYALHDKSPLTFQPGTDTSFWRESITINAILCKSCGHTELVASPSAFLTAKRRTCPHCKAVYSYREQDEVILGVVRCHNCNKEFEIEDDDNADDILEVIKDDLLEE